MRAYFRGREAHSPLLATTAKFFVMLTVLVTLPLLAIMSIPAIVRESVPAWRRADGIYRYLRCTFEMQRPLSEG